MKKLISILLLLSLSILVNAQSEEDQAKILYFDAEKAYNHENYSECISKLEQVEAKLGNTNSRVLELKIKAYSHKKDYANAYIYKKDFFKISNSSYAGYDNILRISEDINKNAYTPLIKIGLTEYNQSNYKNAIKYFEAANEIKTIDNYDVLTKAGLAEYRINDYKNAIKYFEAVNEIKTVDDYDILNAMLICYEKENKPDKAEIYKQKVNEIKLREEERERKERERKEKFNKNITNYNKAKTDKKITEWKSVLKNLGVVQNSILVGDIIALKKELNIPLSYEEKKEEKKIKNMTYQECFDKGKVLSDEKNKYDKALKYFFKTIEKNNKIIGAYSNVGYCYSLLGNYEKALKYVNKDLDMGQDEIWSFSNLGLIYIYMKEYKTALKYFLKVIEKDSKDVNAYAYAGACYYNLDNYEKALKYYKKNLKLKKDLGIDETWTLEQLASTYFDMKNYEAAIKYYFKLIEKDSKNSYAYGNIGNSYRLLKEYEKALKYLNKSLELKKDLGIDETWTLEQLASTYFDMKNYEAAIKYYFKLIEKDSKNSYAYGNIGNSYRLLKEYEKALKYLNKSLELKKELGQNDTWTLKQLAYTYHNMKNYEKAYNISKRLVDKYPDNSSNYFRLSWEALFVNKPHEAITAAKKVLKENPKDGPHFNLAIAYVLINKYEKAKPIFLEWKNKKYGNEQLWKDIFLKGISDLEEAGITHKDFIKVKELLK